MQKIERTKFEKPISDKEYIRTYLTLVLYYWYVTNSVINLEVFEDSVNYPGSILVQINGFESLATLNEKERVLNNWKNIMKKKCAFDFPIIQSSIEGYADIDEGLYIKITYVLTKEEYAAYCGYCKLNLTDIDLDNIDRRFLYRYRRA